MNTMTTIESDIWRRSFKKKNKKNKKIKKKSFLKFFISLRVLENDFQVLKRYAFGACHGDY